MLSTSELFIKLFRGRGDARGSWSGPAIRSALSPEQFTRHLSSPHEEDWFGVYNVIGERCSWGCVDIDTDDLPLARNIQAALGYKQVRAWVEQTTRGYHVWVFPQEPLVQAATMRRALTAACLAVGYHPKEVFPKQTKVTGNGLGNFVRLPCNGIWAEESEHVPRMFVEHTTGLHPLLVAMDQGRTPTATLDRLAATLPETTQVPVSLTLDPQLDADDVVANLPPLPYRIWRDGPLPGSDRSTTLVHLARLCAEADMSNGDTMAVLMSADYSWGKSFMDRGDAGATILHRIVEKAYS